MKLALSGQPCTSPRREALFYCVELFDGCKLTAIQFFDAQQLEGAKSAAIGAIRSGLADSARIIDDQSSLIFRPASRAPAKTVQP